MVCPGSVPLLVRGECSGVHDFCVSPQPAGTVLSVVQSFLCFIYLATDWSPGDIGRSLLGAGFS